MPTYKFKCKKHGEFVQVQLAQDNHIANCPVCTDICRPCAFGGTGFVFSGRNLNECKTGFPDNSAKLNKEVDAMAKEMEQTDTYMHRDIDAATKERAKEVSEQKRKHRSDRFREDPK